MGAAESLSSGIVAQFRATSIDRLGRIEAAWGSLTQAIGTAEAEREIFHDIHTLKGEARLVGFADVVLITQRLEDLLLAAKRRRYRVNEDVDVLVTMAVQFIRMLLRKRAGSSQGGIDINGFLKQIDEVLQEWPRQSETPDGSGSTAPRTQEPGKVSVAVRQRLGGAATLLYLELLDLPDRDRLRRAWEIVAKELGQLDAVALMPLVRRHAAAAKDVAMELGKEVSVSVDGPDMKVSIEMLDTIHQALLHTLRNAVDHGIESPDARVAAGKPRRGNVAIKIRSEPELIAIDVSDDGAGVDTDHIRRRALALGMLSQDDAQAAPTATLFDLTFAPGFSSRESPSTISGRGIGLDAVRSGIERVGGSISLASQKGAGSTISFRVPETRRMLEVHRVPATREDVTFAIPTTWTLREDTSADEGIDPVSLLGLTSRATSPREGRRIVASRDGVHYTMLVGGDVTRGVVMRICPTSPEDALEVVDSDSERLLLLRPDVFFATR